jgi:hypothetical protein
VLRDAALREILALPRANVYDDVAQILAEEGLAASSVVFPILNNPQSIVAPFFATVTLAWRGSSRRIAMLIEGRAQTGCAGRSSSRPVGLRHPRQPGRPTPRLLAISRARSRRSRPR